MKRPPFSASSEDVVVLFGISARFQTLFQPKGRLPTCYSPVRRCTSHPKVTFSHDLHVLSTPPAFVLSQDQTLQFKPDELSPRLESDPEGPDQRREREL